MLIPPPPAKSHPTPFSYMVNNPNIIFPFFCLYGNGSIYWICFQRKISLNVYICIYTDMDTDMNMHSEYHDYCCPWRLCFKLCIKIGSVDQNGQSIPCCQYCWIYIYIIYIYIESNMKQNACLLYKQSVLPAPVVYTQTIDWNWLDDITCLSFIQSTKNFGNVSHW